MSHLSQHRWIRLSHPWHLAVLLFFIFFTAVGWADTIYKYKDGNGVWHFTDEPPETKASVDTYEGVTTTEPKKRVFIERIKKQGGTTLKITNRYYGPVEVEIYFTEFKNMVSDPSLPKRFVVQARSELNAVRLHVDDPKRAWRYYFRSRFRLGPPDAQHLPPGPYRLPFKAGSAFKVSQAFNGKFSHNSSHSRYAVDFAMPIGTPIVCVRDGVVVDMEQDNIWAGQDKAYYWSRANRIRILHEDGSMALYAHIKRGSSQVSLGEQVSVGQVLAESGNTGFSRGPHLHFVIQKNEDMQTVSLPFTFMGPRGIGITPVKGQVLKAF